MNLCLKGLKTGTMYIETFLSSGNVYLSECVPIKPVILIHFKLAPLSIINNQSRYIEIIKS